MIIVDSMLGKLAKYLRMLGYDVEYITNDKDDSYIVEKSKICKVITRDKELHKRIPNSILVTDYNPKEQLKEVYRELPKPEHGFLELCTECGLKTLEIQSREDLPEYVNKNAEKIFYCTRCGKYYWKGSHISNFVVMLESLGIEVQ
ncbi:MAG: Mut7-C RNAse domain-containing protein [Thermoplasmatales archaeon]